MSLYEAADVWSKVSGGRIVCFRCFKNLSSGKYSVQSADFYQVPIDLSAVANSEKQYLELFAEEMPDVRSEAFDTLQAAIKAHIREFELDEGSTPASAVG